MITVITGQPGNGKTLHALGLVEGWRLAAEKEGKPRPVFYVGIPELTLAWSEFANGAAWMDCPDGAFIVIDECQKVFPVRKQGAPVPSHVAALETHRHRGIDLVLITQHPQLLDIAVRKLAGRHIHVTRTFGRETATLRQWERCVDPHDRSVQSIALVSSFAFPKEQFAWYKSAELHTVRKQLPWKKFALLGGSLAGVLGFGWFAAHLLMAKSEAEAVVPPASAARESRLGGRPGGRSYEARELVPPLNPWPWSAPFYDDVVKVRAAPRVSGCMSMRYADGRLECRCSSQQGSSASVSRDECMVYLQTGIFDPTKVDIDPKAQNIAYLQSKDQEPGQGSTAPAPDATPSEGNRTGGGS